MHEEARQLGAKISEATAMLSMDAYFDLTEAERRLLTNQVTHMLGYQYILNERIALYRGETK
jgi:hypothetical protein